MLIAISIAPQLLGEYRIRNPLPLTQRLYRLFRMLLYSRALSGAFFIVSHTAIHPVAPPLWLLALTVSGANIGMALMTPAKRIGQRSGNKLAKAKHDQERAQHKLRLVTSGRQFACLLYTSPSPRDS